MKISNIINAKEVLTNLSQNKNIPTRVAYKLFLLLSGVEKSLNFFETKRREGFEKYGVEDASGNGVIIPEENMSDFISYLNDIGELECEEKIEKVDISLDIDLGVSPAEIALLEPFVNFVE